MSTHALDVVTMFHALATLEEEFLGKERRWGTRNPEQGRVFSWYDQFKHLLPSVTGLKAKASKDYQELNRFLVEERFEPMFTPFSGIGVVSILDKLVKWLEGKASLTDIRAKNGENYPGFELSPSGVTIYQPVYHCGYLAKLKTQSDDTLWLYLPPKGAVAESGGLEMVEHAMVIMAEARREVAHKYAGAKMPKIDFQTKPDITFLLGANTHDEKGDFWFIAQAFQQFKFRMNEEGARARVATGLGMLRAAMAEPVKLVFDQPFYGWFTQKGLEGLPMAIFFADYDSWKEPAGSLEEM